MYVAFPSKIFLSNGQFDLYFNIFLSGMIRSGSIRCTGKWADSNTVGVLFVTPPVFTFHTCVVMGNFNRKGVRFDQLMPYEK